MRISDWSSDVCSSDLLDRDPSRAPVDGQFRLVEAVETIARGDAVGGNDQIVEIPPAVVAARMDRRHELRAKADAAVIAIEFELDVAVEPLRVVRQLVAPFPFKIGRASCREGVWQSVQISVVAGSFQKKNSN